MITAYFPLALGVALAVVAFFTARRARSQFAWPKTKGTVAVSTIGLGRGFYPDVENTERHSAIE